MSNRNLSNPDTIVHTVTVIMGAVVGLTFLFGLGVPPWVAPLVAPAVAVIGLLLGTRHLALSGATREQLRPARRLLIFSSMVTLALNIADPLVAGEYGKAAYDAVGLLLLIGWAEVGPGLVAGRRCGWPGEDRGHWGADNWRRWSRRHGACGCGGGWA